MAAGLGAYVGENVDGVVARLLDEQLANGGWNREAKRASRPRLLPLRRQSAAGAQVVRGLLDLEPKLRPLWWPPVGEVPDLT